MAEDSFLIKVAPYAAVVALIIGIEDLASSSSPEAPAPATVCLTNRAWAPQDEEDMMAIHPCLTAPQIRRLAFTFAPGTPPAHRTLFLRSVAELRPEAQRLVDAVDSLVRVRSDLGGRFVGASVPRGNGRFEVRLAMDEVLAGSGEREVKRLIAHELGHVVDDVVLDEEVKARLDTMIPYGLWCPRRIHPQGCSRRAERFAVMFARWATRDAFIDTAYRVPLPSVPLEVWGAPLTHLADQVGPPP